jgi:hypothetical protein
MPLQSDPRKRVVVFRLTEGEYMLLKNASSRARRSISDFTRAELLAIIAGMPHREGGDNQIQEQLSGLQTSLEDLKELVSCIISEIRSTPERERESATGRETRHS